MSQSDEPSAADLAARITAADEVRREPSPPIASPATRRRQAREAGCWFMPRSWGGGWRPVSWQGYVVSAAAGLLMILSPVVLAKFAAFVSILVVVLATLFVAEMKGKPARPAQRSVRDP